MKYKAIVCGDIKADLKKRTLVAYASKFGNVDHGKDIVHRGAFAESIAQRVPQKKVKTLWSHWDLIGHVAHAEEDDFGLLTESRISKTRQADDTLAMIDDGTINEMSFGFDILESDITHTEEQGKIRNLRKLKLWEVSPVMWGMNEETVIVGLKQMMKSGMTVPGLDGLINLIDNWNGFTVDQKHEFNALIHSIKSKVPPEYSRPSVMTGQKLSGVQKELRECIDIFQNLKGVIHNGRK